MEDGRPTSHPDDAVIPALLMRPHSCSWGGVLTCPGPGKCYLLSLYSGHNTLNVNTRCAGYPSCCARPTACFASLVCSISFGNEENREQNFRTCAQTRIGTPSCQYASHQDHQKQPVRFTHGILATDSARSPSARYLVVYFHCNGVDLGMCRGFCNVLRKQFRVHVRLCSKKILPVHCEPRRSCGSLTQMAVLLVTQTTASMSQLFCL